MFCVFIPRRCRWVIVILPFRALLYLIGFRSYVLSAYMSRFSYWVNVMLPFQGVAVYNWLKAIYIISLWQRHRFIIIHAHAHGQFFNEETNGISIDFTCRITSSSYRRWGRYRLPACYHLIPKVIFIIIYLIFC